MSGQRSNNQQTIATPDTVLLTTEERIEFIARLIVDRIAEDEINGFTLLGEIEAQYGNEQTAS